MKGQQLHAAFARKREAEHVRFEKSTALNRYFDHWDKQNSRFQSWTTPEYYEQADENLRKSKEKKIKEQRLEERRTKLRKLVRNEREIYENEIESLRKPKPRRRIETEILQQIDKNLKVDEEERRRIELEAKLYSRWRHGTEDENKLYESKSDHEVLAKLNWMDKQIEEKMAREEREREMEKINLQKQEEARLRREYLLGRQKAGEIAIKEIQNLEESHMEELKKREEENDALKVEERWYRDFVDKLEDEIALLTKKRCDIAEMATVPNSTKRVKMMIRDRSNINRQDLKNDIEMLRRIEPFCKYENSVQNLLKTLNEQYEKDNDNHLEIESMYESEAKSNLVRCQQAWARAARVRNDQIFECLGRQRRLANGFLTENLEKQRDLIDIREAHYAAIDNCNEKLKILLKEQDSCTEEAISAAKPIEYPTPVASPVATPRQLATYRSRSGESNPDRDSVGKIIKDFSDFYNRNDNEKTDEKKLTSSDSRMSVGDSFRDNDMKQLSRSASKMTLDRPSAGSFHADDMRNANAIGNANRNTYGDDDMNLESSRSVRNMKISPANESNDGNLRSVPENASRMTVGGANNDDNLRSSMNRGVSQMTLDELYPNDFETTTNANFNENRIACAETTNGDDNKSVRSSFSQMGHGDTNLTRSVDMRNANFNPNQMSVGSALTENDGIKLGRRSVSRIGYGETTMNGAGDMNNVKFNPNRMFVDGPLNDDDDIKSTGHGNNRMTFDGSNQIGSASMRNNNRMALVNASNANDEIKSTGRSVSNSNFNRRNESQINNNFMPLAAQNHSPRSDVGSVMSACDSNFSQVSGPKFGRKRVAWN